MHSVLIIDDHDVVRLGLEALLLLCQQVRVTGSADSLKAGLAAMERLHPDLVISDMGLADSAGLDTVRALAVADGPHRLLIVTMQDEMLYGEQTLALGADGFLMKDSVQANLVTAVLTILQGGTWVSPRLTAWLLNRHLRRNNPRRKQAVGELVSLSTRELEVLELLRAGKSTKEIAGVLQLSARTVDIHRANMKKKLGLRSGAELIAFASRRPGMPPADTERR
jgi:DNA-binding NarL/FixJ family response regulator